MRINKTLWNSNNGIQKNSKYSVHKVRNRKVSHQMLIYVLWILVLRNKRKIPDNAREIVFKANIFFSEYLKMI